MYLVFDEEWMDVTFICHFYNKNVFVNVGSGFAKWWNSSAGYKLLLKLVV